MIYIYLMKKTVSDIILGIIAYIVISKKNNNIKCYIHRTKSQGSPTLEQAPGSKTKIVYVISSKKK